MLYIHKHIHTILQFLHHTHKVWVWSGLTYLVSVARSTVAGSARIPLVEDSGVLLAKGVQNCSTQEETCIKSFLSELKPALLPSWRFPT